MKFSCYWKGIVPLSLWISALGFGFAILLQYSNTPGESGIGLEKYPSTSTLKSASGLPTLLIFGHPKCPCTRASIAELEGLLPYVKDKIKIYIVFVKPKNEPMIWAKEALWEKSQGLPGVQTVLDEDGVEAARFGAKTSGQTYLYGTDGNLLFRGGITASRGHIGDNSGRDSILTFVQTGQIGVASTPVFGCALANPERARIWSVNDFKYY